LKPLKSTSQTSCSFSGGKFKMAFSMQYTNKYLICPFIDLEFCSRDELTVITGNQHKAKHITFEFDP